MRVRSSPVLWLSWSASRVGPTATTDHTLVALGDGQRVALAWSADRTDPRSLARGTLVRWRHVVAQQPGPCERGADEHVVIDVSARSS